MNHTRTAEALGMAALAAACSSRPSEGDIKTALEQATNHSNAAVPVVGEQSTATAARFVKGSNGWTMSR